MIINGVNVGSETHLSIEDFGELLRIVEQPETNVIVEGNNLTFTSDNDERTVALSSDELSDELFTIGNVTVGESLSNPELSSIMVELKKMEQDSTGAMVATEQSVYTYITPSNNDNMEQPTYPPVNPPLCNTDCYWVKMVYPKNEIVSISCDFTNPDNGTKLYASWTIFPQNNPYFNMSYSPSTQKINIARTSEGQPDSGSSYNLIIMNNSMIVNTIPFTYTGQLVQISVNSLPVGTYYLTITDPNSNIYGSQSVSIY